MMLVVLCNLDTISGDESLSVGVLLGILEEELNGSANTFVTNQGRGVGESLEVDLLQGDSVEEMIQIILEFKSLVNVRSIVEESGRSDFVV